MITNDPPTTVENISTLLAARGRSVEWPVTGMLLIDGVEIDASEILELASDAIEACDHIECKLESE